MMILNFKKILITGGNGQLACSIRKKLMYFENIQILNPARDELDITNELAVRSFFQNHNGIDLCINCAAYTQVDLAEQNKEEAYSVNVLGVRYLAEASKEAGALFVHFSSDYVYDNALHIPMDEEAPTTPKSVYAQSKREGELEIIKTLSSYFIFRTSWLYGISGQNFVTTMIRLSKDRKELKIVNDQIGAPTFTDDLADMVSHILSDEQFLNDTHFGIYNISNSGQTNWHEFAQEIFRLAHLKVNCLPTTTAEYGAAAARPLYSVLSLQKIQKHFNLAPRHWKDALEECMLQAGLLPK